MNLDYFAGWREVATKHLQQKFGMGKLTLDLKNLRLPSCRCKDGEFIIGFKKSKNGAPELKQKIQVIPVPSRFNNDLSIYTSLDLGFVMLKKLFVALL